MFRTIFTAALAVTLVACESTPMRRHIDDAPEIRVTTHRDGDDLLTAGMGHGALLQPAPPAFANADAPTPAELRRRAIYHNWRGIADVTDSRYVALPSVPGREYHTFSRAAGARAAHRIMVQIPDAFDRGKRCVVVAAASGSRSVYGAIAVAAPWALPRGCAVAYTDKGAGTAFFDVDTRSGAALDGTRARQGEAALEFTPHDLEAAAPHAVAFAHAHSGENPEADWGRHVLDAARFALEALSDAFPDEPAFTAQNTRVIAVGLSNGGGAVLRAAEDDDAGLLDAVVAGAPNVLPPNSRPLFDFGTEAALLQPCALLALPDAPALLPAAASRALAEARCASLAKAGLVQGATVEAQARDALAQLEAAGWSRGPLELTGVQVATDLWRAVLVGYAHAYARTGLASVCRYSYAMVDASQNPRASTEAERAIWWSDATGIPPSTGVAIVDGHARDAMQSGEPDTSYAGLKCLRDLYLAKSGELGRRLEDGIEATRATALPKTRHIAIVHGRDDSLIPLAFTSRPYVEAARANGATIDYVELDRVQHFDAFLALPALVGRYVPLLPEIHRKLDEAWSAIQ